MLEYCYECFKQINVIFSVLSDSNVADIIQSGFTDVFPILVECQDVGIRRSVFTEIKTEVANTDTEQGNTSDDTIEQSVSDDEAAESDMNLRYSNDQSDDASATPVAEDTAVTNKRKRSRPHQIKPSKSNGDSNCPIPQNRRRVKCTVCDVYYSNKYILKRHCLREHPDDWFEFKCKDCSSMFKTSKYLLPSNNIQTLGQRLRDSDFVPWGPQSVFFPPFSYTILSIKIHLPIESTSIQIV